MTIKIHANPGPALAAVITCASSTTGIPDMTNVSASVLKVRGPGAQVVTWAVTVDSVSSSALVLRHVYVADVDFVLLGKYQLWAEHTLPSGVVTSKDVLNIEVVARWVDL